MKKVIQIVKDVLNKNQKTTINCYNTGNEILDNDLKIVNSRLIKYSGKEETFVIPSDITNIAAQAFAGNTSLKEIIIPESVTLIGGLAFANCSNLSRIEIHNKDVIIGEGAFDRTEWYNQQDNGVLYLDNILYSVKGDCPSEVFVKEGTNSISEFAFSDLKGLNKVYLPKSLRYIGNAFCGCKNLKKILIYQNVELIAENAFNNCDVTLYGIKDSYAHSYAKKHNIKFVIYEPKN